ncbi:hypothetical protein ZIOFF_001209 [Zingiber officinale]|uniref:UBN2 domain-containing protein n=1 Tax=Zingiber officinale TaxID=94328 RepID=A0A8J5M773_ZINOF|nr:hypothetical protein ZIOFF_001209 [Zingiber officinale]
MVSVWLISLGMPGRRKAMSFIDITNVDWVELPFLRFISLREQAPINANPDELAEFEKWSDHNLQARYYMMSSMSNEVQKQFEETMNSIDIHIHLQELYGTQTSSVRHVTVKELMTSHMQDEALVHKHGVKMIGLIEKLVNLDLVILHELSTDIILLSLPSSFDNFVVNFNINNLEATLEELVNMIVNYEATMKKEKSIFLVDSSSGSKKGPMEKGKKHSAPIKKIMPNKKLRCL